MAAVALHWASSGGVGCQNDGFLHTLAVLSNSGSASTDLGRESGLANVYLAVFPPCVFMELR